MLLPSFHDFSLVGYAVDCGARQVVLRLQPASSTKTHVVIFSGVQGYVFENDAFGNLVFELQAVSPTELIVEESVRINEMFRQSGAPGPWAADLPAASARFTEQGLFGYVLSSSYGMSGWVLAQSAEHVVQHIIPSDLARLAATGR
jgi:hypothetical protein